MILRRSSYYVTLCLKVSTKFFVFPFFDVFIFFFRLIIYGANGKATWNRMMDGGATGAAICYSLCHFQKKCFTLCEAHFKSAAESFLRHWMAPSSKVAINTFFNANASLPKKNVVASCAADELYPFSWVSIILTLTGIKFMMCSVRLLFIAGSFSLKN